MQNNGHRTSPEEHWTAILVCLVLGPERETAKRGPIRRLGPLKLIMDFIILFWGAITYQVLMQKKGSCLRETAELTPLEGADGHSGT